jgi:hypothetical protein
MTTIERNGYGVGPAGGRFAVVARNLARNAFAERDSTDHAVLIGGLRQTRMVELDQNVPPDAVPRAIEAEQGTRPVIEA